MKSGSAINSGLVIEPHTSCPRKRAIGIDVRKISRLSMPTDIKANPTQTAAPRVAISNTRIEIAGNVMAMFLQGIRANLSLLQVP